MSTLFVQWFITFALTLAIELAVAWPILGLVDRRRGRRVATILLANALTHPIVFGLSSIPQSLAIVVPLIVGLELGASAFEAWLYHRSLGRQHLLIAVAASSLANAASLGASLVLWRT